MAVDRAQPFEGGAHDQDLEVGLGPLRDAVHPALVFDLEVNRRQRRADPLRDLLLDLHPSILPPLVAWCTIVHPRARATRASARLGPTATGVPTASSSGRSAT